MAKEVYRVEIPIEATDNYSVEIGKAEKSVTQFEAAVKRSTDKAKKRREDFNRGRWSLTLNAVDKASRVVSRVSSYVHRVANRSYRFTLRALDMASRTIGGIRRALTSIPALITVTLGVIGAGKLKEATVGAAMSFEQYETSMTHWLDGNEKKAKSLVKWMGEFADTTPFSSVDLFPALVEGVNLSNGDVDVAKRYLKIASDMAALTPERNVDEAMMAISSAQSGNFEMMKAFKSDVTKAELEAMGGWDNYVKMVEKKFKDGAKKLSETSKGISMTLGGYRDSLLRSVGDGILEPMKPRLESINKWLLENQDTWGRWKDTVRKHGETASEFVFSNLEKGFNHIRTNYLDNNEFMKLGFKGKIEFIMDDVNEWWSSKGKPALNGWWEGSGKPWASKIGLSVGEAIFEGVKTGITKGLETLGDIWGNAFKDPSMSSIGGAGVASVGVGAILAMILNPFIQLGKLLVGVVSWVRNLIPGGGTPPKPGTVPTKDKKPSDGEKSESKHATTTTKTKDSKPSGTKPSSKPSKTPKTKDSKPSGTKPSSKPSKTPNPKVPPTKFSKVLDKINPKNWGKIPPIFKRIPFLGTLLTAGSLIAAPDGEKGKATGGMAGMFAGGAAGAAAGGAIGSVVPIIGNIAGAIIGGLGGSILGSMGGEQLGGMYDDRQANKTVGATGSPAEVGGMDSSGMSMGTDFASLTLNASLQNMSEQATIAAENTSRLASYLGESSGWVVGAFEPLSNSTTLVQSNLAVLTSYIGQASGWIVEGFHGLSGATTVLQTNLGILTSYVGQASGWVVEGFSGLSNSTEVLQSNLSILTSYVGQASGWVVSGFYGLSDATANLQMNIGILTSYVGQASGWVVGGFYPLEGSTSALLGNLSVLTSYVGQASGWVVGGFYPIPEHGAVLSNNMSVLTSYLGQASGWVVAGLYPIASQGPAVSNNLSVLAMYLGMASGWVVSLQGIQSGGSAVSAALSGLAARINSTPAPSLSGAAPSSRRGGPKAVAYANGGEINRPHFGLVGEAGPEMIIPLSSGRRNRAMDLFNRTGELLGVRPYAEGGLAGVEPIVPGYGDSPPALALAGTMGGAVKGGSSSIQVSAPMTFEISGAGLDEGVIKEIISKYGREFVEKLREALNNRSR